jgi:hypothetical protein
MYNEASYFTCLREFMTEGMAKTKRKLICGVGINDADYQVQPLVNGKQIKCPIYSTWRSMLERCYSSKFHKIRQTYIGCTVCSDWLTFSKFREWMIQQDFKDKHLDKDIIVYGNKIYSPSTCIFVTPRVNVLLADCGKARGQYAIGVYFNKQHKKFMSRCRNGINSTYIGLFDTEQEAHQAYLKYKKQVITEVALEQDDIRLKDALLRIADTYEIQL